MNAPSDSLGEQAPIRRVYQACRLTGTEFLHGRLDLAHLRSAHGIR